MKNISLLYFLLLPKLLLAQQPKQFVLFDTEFTYSKENADSSTLSKSHYYVTGSVLNTQRPTDWTTPVDYRNGTVHIRLEVLEKQADHENFFPTKVRIMMVQVAAGEIYDPTLVPNLSGNKQEK